jgi:uracil-DNA glycosylase
LKKADKRTDIIEFLLRTIEPKVVLAHGNAAITFFRKTCRDFVDDRQTPQTVTWNNSQLQFQLLCSTHLGFRGLTHEAAANKAKGIGLALARALKSSRSSTVE